MSFFNGVRKMVVDKWKNQKRLREIQEEETNAQLKSTLVALKKEVSNLKQRLAALEAK